MPPDETDRESGSCPSKEINVEERDLAVILVIAMLSIPSILLAPFNETPLRFVAGLLLIAFLPGYVLVSAVYPWPRDLKIMERAGLSLILSLAVSSVIGLLLAYTVGLIAGYAVLSLFAFTLATAMTARKRRLTAFFRGGYGNVESSGEGLPRCSLYISLMVALSLVAVFYILAVPRTMEPYTEFVVLDSGGRSVDYQVINGGSLNEGVVLEIVNMEYTDMSYRLEIVLGGTELEERVINLGHSERYTALYALNATSSTPSKLEFILYRQPEEEPYMDLYLWVYPAGE